MAVHISVIAAALERASAGGSLPRVKWLHRSGSFNSIRRRGRVQRATGSTIWVVQDGGTEALAMRVNRNSVVDVDLLTHYELALEAWAEEKPDTDLLGVSAGLGEQLHEPDARIAIRIRGNVHQTIAPEQLEELAAEAVILGEWIKRRPENPEG